MNQVKVQGLTYLVKSAGNNFLSKLRRSRPRTNPAPSVSCRQSILSDPPPFTISQSCINEGEKLQAASSRDPYLPAIYEVKSHPRIPKGLDKDVIKRILVIPWPKGDAQYLKFYFHYAETKIHIPGGTNSIIPALGWIKLNAGDILFIRDAAGSGDGMDDSFEAFVGDIDEESKEGILIKQLRDETLGSKAERCTNGCAAFEKCAKRANPVGGSGHCYSCGLSHQKPRNLVTPSVGGKVRGNLSKEEEEHVQMRHNIVTTTIRLAVDMVRRLLPKEYKVLEDACELNNVPRIGTDDNVFYQGVQLNFSQPVHNDGFIINCIKALAFFGGKHFDKHDSCGGWTTMFSYPDIPTGDGWEGGRFHLVEFGVYVELDGIKTITFSGLRLHGGTPPLAPAGVPIPPSAYRWVVVLYPQGATLDGRVTLNIAAGANGAIQLTPQETRDRVTCVPAIEDTDGQTVEEEEEEAPEFLHTSAKELNFLDDGKVIMTPQAEIDFLARSFFLHTLYHQKQILGGSILKYEHYRQGWSIKRDDITYSAGPWPLAPGGLELDSDSSPRETARKQWLQHCNGRLGVISSAFRNFKSPPIRVRISQIPDKRAQAARVAAKRKATSKLKAKSRKNKSRSTISEIIDAAQKTPQVVAFNQKVTVKNLNKTKRDSHTSSEELRRSKRLKENHNTDNLQVHQGSDEEREEQEVVELRSIITHRVCTKMCCNYEYFVEWADAEPGTKEWIHESQIDMGDMYTTYRRNAFTQILEDVNIGSTDNDEQSCESSNLEDNTSDTTSQTKSAVIPFLNRLSRESLSFTIQLFNAGISSKNTMEGASVRELFSKINRFYIALERSPLDSRTMKAAVDVWPSVNLLLENSKVYDAGARILHHTIMLSHYRLYTWVSQSIEYVLDHPSSHWWYRLINAVREIVESGTCGTFHFSSSEFLPMIEPPRTYLWNFQRKQHNQRTANILLVSRIIFHWLGVPIESDDKHRTQSLFLKSLMDSCGTASILLLDEVWSAYSTPHHLCSIRSKRAYPSQTAIKKLGQTFLDHPILGSNRSIEIQQLIDALQTAHHAFVGLPASHDSPSSVIYTASLHSGSLLSPPTLSNTPATSLLHVSRNDRIIFLRDWLLEIAEAYVRSPPLSVDQLSPEQRRVLEDSDSSCPFRELAQSRRQVSSPNGLYTHHSREGIFSALLFRGILFNTEALHGTRHLGFFESFEIWTQFKAQYADRGEKYICNPRAYGTTKGRVSTNDENFWIASEILFEKLQDPNISFTTIWQFVVNARDDHKKKLFPSFGDLSAYLLTVDLTYAQWIPWPDLDEVAQAVFVLAKGALHGLQKIGLVSANSYTKEEVVEGFKTLYRFLDEDPKFKMIKEAVVFDPFMVEHALCKMSKDRIYERANRSV